MLVMAVCLSEARVVRLLLRHDGLRRVALALEWRTIAGHEGGADGARRLDPMKEKTRANSYGSYSHVPCTYGL